MGDRLEILFYRILLSALRISLESSSVYVERPFLVNLVLLHM